MTAISSIDRSLRDWLHQTFNSHQPTHTHTHTYTHMQRERSAVEFGNVLKLKVSGTSFEVASFLKLFTQLTHRASNILLFTQLTHRASTILIFTL